MKYNKNNRIFTGLLFIIAAIILIISKLGYFGDFNLWSLALTIFFVIIIIKSIYPIKFAGILFPLAFLCIIYSKELGIEQLTPWTVLIVATLGTIGLSIIFQNKVNINNKVGKDYEFIAIDEEDKSNIVQKTSFSGITKYINSDDFKQADLHCICGAMEIYFDRAKIKDKTAVVQINATCSVIELFLPKEWTIENHISTTLSGIDEKNRNTPDGSATLLLIGEITLSGITITFV
ncbi:hypothetical protein KDJ93_11460 [Clostridium butyricum]|uniref:LiaF transmembrane domain-containing protein n=1 Tax=Clostridium butyricum TaxID=1492 RepID=UPI001BA75AAB|nr:hypothetical protein [Clostridium butyricum]QUF82350.1 hypothetical protein KDJ93_11460 [Clostridium butyricum]